MLVGSSNGTYEFIDFRETAPAAAFENMYEANSNLSLYGGLASGVPGELRGLEHLHKKYGSLPWKKLMQPAINLARYGFNVTEDLVRYMASAATSYDFLTYDETWAMDFALNGTRLGLGDVMTRKRYANTLESISEHGPDAFYKGAIANATITALQKLNGTMALSDLANYTIAIRDPSYITYRGFKIHSGQLAFKRSSCAQHTEDRRRLRHINTVATQPFYTLSGRRNALRIWTTNVIGRSKFLP